MTRCRQAEVAVKWIIRRASEARRRVSSLLFFSPLHMDIARRHQFCRVPTVVSFDAAYPRSLRRDRRQRALGFVRAAGVQVAIQSSILLTKLHTNRARIARHE